MSLPHFSNTQTHSSGVTFPPSGLTFPLYNFKTTKRKTKICIIVSKINKRIGEAKLKISKKRGFAIGSKFYYYSKYGSRQKHIVHRIRQYQDIVYIYGEHFFYEIEYCFTETEIREKKLKRLLEKI